MLDFVKHLLRPLQAFFRGSALPAQPLGDRSSPVSTTPDTSKEPIYVRQYLLVVEVSNQAEARDAVEKEDALALVRAERGFKWLVFRCPCGCSEIRRVSLSPSVSPAWRLRISDDGTISVYPSVDLMSECRAHFVLRNNVAYGS